MGRTNLERNGAAQAALLGAAAGFLALAAAEVGSRASEAFRAFIQGVGKAVLPAAAGIGPAGKEVIALAVWLGAWFAFHRLLRDREWNAKLVVFAFLVATALATTLLWPPVAHVFEPK
jgi:hypothetical protein